MSQTFKAVSVSTHTIAWYRLCTVCVSDILPACLSAKVQQPHDVILINHHSIDSVYNIPFTITHLTTAFSLYIDHNGHYLHGPLQRLTNPPYVYPTPLQLPDHEKVMVLNHELEMVKEQRAHLHTMWRLAVSPISVTTIICILCPSQ